MKEMSFVISRGCGLRDESTNNKVYCELNRNNRAESMGISDSST